MGAAEGWICPKCISLSENYKFGPSRRILGTRVGKFNQTVFFFHNFEDRLERLSPGVVSGSHSGWDTRGVLVGCSRDARGVLVGCAGAAGAAGAAECRSKRRGRRGRPAFERRILGVPGCHTKLAGLSRGCPGVTRGDCRTRLETTRDSTRSKSLISILRVEDDLPSNAGYFLMASKRVT